MKHATIFDNSKTYICGRKNYSQDENVYLRIKHSKPTFPAYAFKKYLNDNNTCKCCLKKCVTDYGL